MDLYIEVPDFYNFFEDSLVDPTSIKLQEDDIDDDTVHIDVKNLACYKAEHLKKWLIYRGDTLKGIDTLKETQVRVLQYYKNGTQNNIVDPTSDKKWLRKKAEKLGILLSPGKTNNGNIIIQCPEVLRNEIGHPKNAAGWTKDITNLPKITIYEIEQYHKKINDLVLEKSLKIKKPFTRGAQFLEENFVDVGSIHAKENDNIFSLKGVCGASLKKADRWIFVAIDKLSNEILYCFCQCPAGKVGTCSHAYALMKLLAKWVLDNLKIIPEPKACTSKACEWSVPQSRNRVDKVPISDITITSPVSKRRNTNDDTEYKKRSGIKTTLYDARADHTKHEPAYNLEVFLNSDTNNHAKKIINPNPLLFTDTVYGVMPIGSTLSHQCSPMPADFAVYSSISTVTGNLTEYNTYPSFPFNSIKYMLDEYLRSEICEEKLAILNELRSHSAHAVEIEVNTRDQARDANWFMYRKNRFTASICNKIGDLTKKTEKGIKTIAHNIVFGDKNEKNKVVQMKMRYGKFFEPIAIQAYEKFMHLSGWKISVDQCGLVIDSQNFVLGATPDGKVFDGASFGILEVKCSEHYKDIDPKDVCSISKEPCIVYNSESNTIHINKNHTYYNQVQMQLALTCQTWCDFVFYTSKGMVIDRVQFDAVYWEKLQSSILSFYFKYVLPEIVSKEKK